MIKLSTANTQLLKNFYSMTFRGRKAKGKGNLKLTRIESKKLSLRFKR